jgi:hypothetical protein
MGRFMFRRWRWTVEFLADTPMDVRQLLAIVQMGVAVRPAGKRPNEALFALIYQDHIAVVSESLTTSCSSSKRISVPPPSPVVRTA